VSRERNKWGRIKDKQNTEVPQLNEEQWKIFDVIMDAVEHDAIALKGKRFNELESPHTTSFYTWAAVCRNIGRPKP
jgi:hypothetical protein